MKVAVDGETTMSVAEGHGPVNALDLALRKDLGKYQSEIEDLELVDYKVRILNGGTEAITRVLIESPMRTGARWWTVGVSDNIIDASFQALMDSIVFKLMKNRADGRAGARQSGSGFGRTCMNQRSARIRTLNIAQDELVHWRAGVGGKQNDARAMADTRKHQWRQAGHAARFAFALTAYLLWGFLPFFMKAVAHIPAFEDRRPPDRLVGAARRPRARAARPHGRRDGRPAHAAHAQDGVADGGLITVNWGIYVWAIGAGRALETALGYYINPLFTILLGAVLLKEKLNPRADRRHRAGGLRRRHPRLRRGRAALGLDRPCAFLGPLRLFPQDAAGRPQPGLLPRGAAAQPAGARLHRLSGARGRGPFLRTGLANTLWLLACGVVTAVPLMVFANGAKLLRLSTIGIMQYIAPTMIFLIAVFAFHEPFGAAKLAAFILIWAALAIYSRSMLLESRARRAELAHPAE